MIYRDFDIDLALETDDGIKCQVAGLARCVDSIDGEFAFELEDISPVDGSALTDDDKKSLLWQVDDLLQDVDFLDNHIGDYEEAEL